MHLMTEDCDSIPPRCCKSVSSAKPSPKTGIVAQTAEQSVTAPADDPSERPPETYGPELTTSGIGSILAFAVLLAVYVAMLITIGACRLVSSPFGQTRTTPR